MPTASAAELVEAARVTPILPPGERGLWTVEVHTLPDLGQRANGRLEAHYPSGLFPGEDYTALRRATMATLHTGGEVVMEDTRLELRRHLPILLAARGRVLVSGLGLGAVVLGLASRPEVESIDVVEVDRDVIELVWPFLWEALELRTDVTVRLYDGSAFEPRRLFGTKTWDYAWHDIWSEDESLQVLHGRLFELYRERARFQGAWQFPRWVRRLLRRKGLARWLLEGRPGDGQLHRLTAPPSPSSGLIPVAVGHPG